VAPTATLVSAEREMRGEEKAKKKKVKNITEVSLYIFFIWSL